jgi:hypothetical protein
VAMTMPCWCTAREFAKHKNFSYTRMYIQVFWPRWLIDKAQDDTWSSIMAKIKKNSIFARFDERHRVEDEMKTNVWC